MLVDHKFGVRASKRKEAQDKGTNQTFWPDSTQMEIR
jgi:hypothetical protein